MSDSVQAEPEAASRNCSERKIRVFQHSILIIWSAITIFIFLWLVLSSFKTNVEIFGSPWALPAKPVAAFAANYGKAWNLSKMGAYFGNSVIVTSLSVLLVVGVSAPAAYALTRIRFFGNTFLSFYFIAGMGLPFQLILIPLFVLLTRLGLANSLQGLVLALCRGVSSVHHPPVDRILPHASDGARGRCIDRRLLRVRHLLADHVAAVGAGLADRRHPEFCPHLERVPFGALDHQERRAPDHAARPVQSPLFDAVYCGLGGSIRGSCHCNPSQLYFLSAIF